MLQPHSHTHCKVRMCVWHKCLLAHWALCPLSVFLATAAPTCNCNFIFIYVVVVVLVPVLVVGIAIVAVFCLPASNKHLWRWSDQSSLFRLPLFRSHSTTPPPTPTFTCCVTPSSVLFGLGAAYLTMKRVADSSAYAPPWLPRLSAPRLALTCNSCVDTVESQSFHSHPAASPPGIASVVAATSFALISVRSKDMNANSTSLAHIRCDTPLALPGKTSLRSRSWSSSRGTSRSRSRTRLFRPLGACQRYATLGKRMKRKRTSDKCCLRVVRFYCGLKACTRRARGGGGSRKGCGNCCKAFATMCP